jgi:hypothetical protein
MMAVAKTLYGCLSLGTANPVQPTSSSTVVSPAAIPDSKTAALPSAARIGEGSESTKSTAAAKTGAGTSAATHQRAPARSGQQVAKVPRDAPARLAHHVDGIDAMVLAEVGEVRAHITDVAI